MLDLRAWAWLVEATPLWMRGRRQGVRTGKGAGIRLHGAFSARGQPVIYIISVQSLAKACYGAPRQSAPR